MTSLQPVLGIVVPADFIKRRPFGGSSGLVENLVDKLTVPTMIFGIGVDGTPPWQIHRLNHTTSFIPVAHFSYPSQVPMRLKCLIGFWRQRCRILQSGVDALYIHSPELALPFLFGSLRVPVIFHQHGSGNPVTQAKYSWARSLIFQKIFDFILREVHRRSDWTIVIDRLCLEQARRNGIGHKVSLIMNAVDIETFYPDEEVRQDFLRRFKIADEERVVLFVGRLEKIKRVDRVVASLDFLNKVGANGRYRLFIAGEGTLGAELEAAAKTSGLKEVITFLGRVPHQELPGYYNMADVLVLPSEMEGVPMVILEALACGTPVVASRVGGIPEVVRDGINGITLNDAGAHSLAAAIRQVCERRYRRQEVAATVKSLSSAQFAEELLAVVKGILGREETLRKNVFTGS